MTTLTLLSSMATKQVLADLIDQFQQRSPHRVQLESVGGVDAAKRVQAGEAFDVIALAANACDQLQQAGHIVPGSVRALVHSGVAAAVKSGTAKPDLSTEASVKQAVLDAQSLSYSTGPSGVQLAKLFERWGIAETLKPRIVQAPPGVPVGSLVAKGEVALGFQQLSELISLPGIDVVGPLPPEIQITTTFSAGVAATSTQADAAQAFIDFMASPDAAEAKRRQGMEPA